MYAISNEELQNKPVRKDGKATCKNCKRLHSIKFGTDAKTGAVSTTLGFVNCPENGKSYIASINGKSI